MARKHKRRRCKNTYKDAYRHTHTQGKKLYYSGWRNGQTHMYRWTGWLADRRTDGNARYTKLTDEQTDRRTDGRTYVRNECRSSYVLPSLTVIVCQASWQALLVTFQQNYTCTLITTTRLPASQPAIQAAIQTAGTAQQSSSQLEIAQKRKAL